MPQEETATEDAVTVSVVEYQKMKEALENMEMKRKAEIKRKKGVERTVTIHLLNLGLLSLADSIFAPIDYFTLAAFLVVQLSSYFVPEASQSGLIVSRKPTALSCNIYSHVNFYSSCSFRVSFNSFY